ncbi:DUF192 domain-containing protein [bacterium]|nr:DUF192 domain-containing protein [bacterium]MDB4235001.1 DUF192 domain-containing protein [bacterium]
MKVIINNYGFNIKIVDKPTDIQKGMMGKKFDSTFSGMLFLMGGNEHCFWMKNCIIPLDIIFIKNKVITKIHKDCKPCKTEDCGNFCGEGNIVLELPSGSCDKMNFKVGNTIKIIRD